MIDLFLAGTPLHALKSEVERQVALNAVTVRNAERAMAARERLYEEWDEASHLLRSPYRRSA